MTDDMKGATAPMRDIGGIDEALARLGRDRKMKAILPGKGTDGKDDIILPSWFKRTGIRLFEIDTGMGIVRCHVPKYERKDPDADLTEDEVVELVVRALKTIPPDWKVEVDEDDPSDEVKINGTKLDNGAEVPLPTGVKSLPLEDKRTYLSLLPRSLPSQVSLALGLMALPPLPTDPTA
jgi:hypothetical protein